MKKCEEKELSAAQQKEKESKDDRLHFCVLFVQLVQVIINTTHLEQSCHFLEEFISNITNVPPDTVNATKLYGTSTFKVRLLFLSLSPLFSPAVLLSLYSPILPFFFLLSTQFIYRAMHCLSAT